MDFTNQAQAANSVVNITNWNGDPNCADFVLEFYNGNYQITPEGLRMNLNRATKPNVGNSGTRSTQNPDLTLILLDFSKS